MALTLNGSTGISGISGSAGTPALQGNNDANTGYFFATDTLGLSTAGTERLKVTSAGLISIGDNNNLDSQLTITQAQGDCIRLRTNASNNTYKYGIIKLEPYNNNALGVQIVGAKSDSGYTEVDIGGGIDGGYAATQLDFWTAANTTTATGTRRLRINSTGNVIIGQTTAGFQSKLTTGAGSSDEAITILSGTSSGGSLYFADGTAADDTRYRGWVQYIHTSDYLTIGTAAGERLRIDTNGNVSIGGIAPVPTDPAYNKALLHIHQTQSGTYGSELHLTNNTTGSAVGDGMFLSMWTDNDVYFTNQEAGDINFTTNGHEAFKIQSNKNVKITDGNLIIDTAGHGIDFSAQTASSATDVTVSGELLDHFEEGTWTPVQPTVGWYSGAEIEGKYQRVGHWVTASFIIKFPNNGSGIQGLIDGLPFVSGGSGSAARHGGAPTYTTDSNVQSFLIGNGEARIYIYNGNGSAVQCSNLDDDEIRGNVIYRVA